MKDLKNIDNKEFANKIDICEGEAGETHHSLKVIVEIEMNYFSVLSHSFVFKF